MAAGLLKADEITSVHLAVYALSLLSGATQKVHTEDIAKKCFEIAPSRFRWEKYDYPDKELVRKALFHASEKRNDSLVTGRSGGEQKGKNRDGWQLTPTGAAFIRDFESTLKEAVGVPVSSMPRKEADRIRRRLRSEEMFKTYQRQKNLNGVSHYMFTDLLNCSPDAPRETVQQKLNRLVSTAEFLGDEDVLNFLSECRNAFSDVLPPGESK